eukprot:11210197-Lingulodinium_polyedra.AAC.1
MGGCRVGFRSRRFPRPQLPSGRGRRGGQLGFRIAVGRARRPLGLRAFLLPLPAAFRGGSG